MDIRARMVLFSLQSNGAGGDMKVKDLQALWLLTLGRERWIH